MACAPPPPPPPTQTSLFSAKSNVKDGRGLLLDSIRKGTKLKKTVTNDKSTPAITGNVVGSSAGQGNVRNGSARTSINGNNRSSNDAAGQSSPMLGLGGLFANGIPQLKRTGLPIGQTYQQSRTEVQDKQPSNVHHNAIPNHTSNIRNRGPPPQPPVAQHKSLTSDMNSNNFAHHKTSSAVSLNNTSYQNRSSPSSVTDGIGNDKPAVAPKPHFSNKTLSNSKNINKVHRLSVDRTQSMRIPKSSNTTNGNENGYNETDPFRMNGRGELPSFHQSQESLGRRASPPRLDAQSWASAVNNPNATLRPHHRSVRPPLTKPPPPPARLVNPPTGAPPPPPTHAPPPPPHRVSPAPPPPPSVGQRSVTNVNNNTGNPPMPPMRITSIRPEQIKSSPFESRFSSLFHSKNEFPTPPPYESVLKIYNSKVQAKQPAPQPPMFIQYNNNRKWQCENTYT